MSGQVIDFHFSLAQSLGLHVEVVRDAAPIMHEMGMRFGEVLKDIAADLAPDREAMALAESMAAAVMLQTCAEFLQEDEETFYFRLMEAADRGLFDLDLNEATPRLAALYAQHIGDTDEDEG